MRPFKVPALILDFKDDYSESVYAETEGFNVYDPSDQSLPFNPLAPSVDPRSGRVNPTHHLHQLTDIIKRIYRLGDQQAYRLREAMKTVYENGGVPMQAFVPDAEQTYPAFEAVQDVASPRTRTTRRCSAGCRRSSTSGCSAGCPGHRLRQRCEQTTVIRLAQLPGDEVKNSVAEFFLMALYNYLDPAAAIAPLSRLAVLDEAWRLVESPFLEPLMREGRAFGLASSSHLSSHRPPSPSLVHRDEALLLADQRRADSRHPTHHPRKTSGTDADHLAGIMRGLPPLTCVLYSKQFPRFVRVAINPYFERHT